MRAYGEVKETAPRTCKTGTSSWWLPSCPFGLRMRRSVNRIASHP